MSAPEVASRRELHARRRLVMLHLNKLRWAAQWVAECIRVHEARLDEINAALERKKRKR